MNPKSRMLAIMLLAMVPGVAMPAVYKWVDENGQVQYTQTPPPGGIEATEMKPPPPPADQEGALQRQERLQKALDERRESHDTTAKAAAEDAEYAKQKAQRCDAAKGRLERAQRPRINFVAADGSERRATEEEREQEMKAAEAQVGEFCD